MSVVAIDIGNSHTKLYIPQQPIVVLNNKKLSEQLKQLGLALCWPAISEAVVSSVIDTKTTQLIITTLAKQLCIPLNKIQQVTTIQILSHALPSQVHELAHLGSDRALRIYYLTQIKPSLTQMSIGCGSAFTIEVVHQHKLIASMILPGVSLQLTSLARNTANLPLLTPTQLSQVLASHQPLSTSYAITSGVLSAYLALIDSLARRYQPQRIIISGGNSELLANYATNFNFKLNVKKYLEAKVLVNLLYR
jgi:pantothenate kinase type III